MASIQYYGTGRRKTSVARVYLRPGRGDIKVNDRGFDIYFENERLRYRIKHPLMLTNTDNKFDILIRVSGGGKAGQADAVRHGISKALLEYNGELREKLKSEGMLSRDARRKERKKYGQKGARAKFQFSKR